MAALDGDLAELEAFVGGLLKALEPRERLRLFRRVATNMRRQNRARIKSQRNPDGSRFAARKPPPKPQMGQYAVKFLYPSGGSGHPRLVFMKSWEKQGPVFRGYDIEARGMRTFEYAKVIKWLRVDDAEQNRGAGRLRSRSTIRQKAMFRKIGRQLYTGQNDHEAWIGFGGMIAQVARVHQLGLKDRPARGAREVRYERRELLGMSAGDREDLLDAVIEHLVGG